MAPPTNAPRLRRLAGAAGMLAVALALAGSAVHAAGERYRRRDHGAELAGLRGALVSAEQASLEVAGGFETLSVTLRDDRGLTVLGHLKVEVGAAGPQPALILLGGVETGRETVDYLEDSQGTTLLALDYPYEGKTRHLGLIEFARAVPAMRRAVLRTVPAVALAVDYLRTRPEVDPERIVVIGGSLGALFAPAAGACDPRIAAVGLLFGAGDLGGVARANLTDLGPLARPVAWAASVLTAPLEPLRYVGEISPRPLFMLNGTGDERMPVEFARALHDAAGEPKTVRWIDAGHVHLDETEFHDQVRGLLTDWLRDHELLE